MDELRWRSEVSLWVRERAFQGQRGLSAEWLWMDESNAALNSFPAFSCHVMRRARAGRVRRQAAIMWCGWRKPVIAVGPCCLNRQARPWPGLRGYSLLAVLLRAKGIRRICLWTFWAECKYRLYVDCNTPNPAVRKQLWLTYIVFCGG